MSRSRVRKSNAPRGRRIIAYIRVSDTTGREDTLISDDVQLNEIKRLCTRMGWVIVDTVVELDKSGRTSDKRGIGKIIDRIAAKEADGVVVWKISRWGRNTMDSLLNIGELQEAGGFLASATENLDDIDTPAGKFSLTVLLAIAQMFSDEIGKTWVNIHDYRRGQGKTHSATRRFGYLRVKDIPEAERGQYDIPTGGDHVPDPEVAPWLRQAFEWYVSGVSVYDIAARFQAANVTSNRGNPTTPNGLRTSMDSGFAAGKVVDRRGETVEYADGAHTAIIDADLWAAYLRRRHAKVAPRSKSAPHQYAGLLTCKGCGGGMYVAYRNSRDEDGNRHRFFRCGRLSKVERQTVCPAPAAIAEWKLAEIVHGWLTENADDTNALKVQMARAAASSYAQADRAKVERDIDRATKRLSKLTDLMVDDQISREAYVIKETEIKADLARLRELSETLGTEVAVHDIPAHTAFQAVLAGWDKLDPAVLNQGLRHLVGAIEITQAGGRNKTAAVQMFGTWERKGMPVVGTELAAVAS